MTISAMIQKALQEAGLQSNGETFRKVTSSCIKSSTGQLYFVKTGSDISEFEQESESLKALGAGSPDIVPKVYYCKSVSPGQAVMISDYFDLASKSRNSSVKLATKLASELHNPDNSNSLSPTGKYGFHIGTCCGATEQDNTWEQDWMVFFRDRRIRDILDRIGDPELLEYGNQLCDKVIPVLLTNFEPAPAPVILHGDLWAGNTASRTDTGSPVIYDPSSYYGHNEADLGIARMFGGFGRDFFDKYHEIRPRSQPLYEERAKLYELYHHVGRYIMLQSPYKWKLIEMETAEPHAAIWKHDTKGMYKYGAMRLMEELLTSVGEAE